MDSTGGLDSLPRPSVRLGQVFTSNFTWSVIFWHYAFTDAAMSGHETGERVWGDDMWEMAWPLVFDLV